MPANQKITDEVLRHLAMYGLGVAGYVRGEPVMTADLAQELLEARDSLLAFRAFRDLPWKEIAMATAANEKVAEALANLPDLGGA